MEIIDADSAIAELGGDHLAYIDICRLFLQQAAGALDALQSASSRQASGDGLALLHDCANASGAIGATRAMECLRELELALCRNPMAEHLDEVVAVAQDCLRNVVTSLADWLVKQGCLAAHGLDGQAAASRPLGPTL